MSTKSNTPTDTDILLTRSQEAALTQLLALAAINFSNPRSGPIRLRTTALVIGPSGVGKSHLVRELGRRLGIGILSLSYGTWIVDGSRHELPTMRRIRQELEKDRPLIIHVDEVDKFVFTDDPWGRSLFAELYSVLDREPGAVAKGPEEPGGSRPTGWTEELVRRLKTRVMFVLSGTWMDIFQTRIRRPIGFHAGPTRGQSDWDVSQVREMVRTRNIIPPELLNRACEDWLLLEPYTEEDFRHIARQLGLAPSILDPAEAAASGLNMRAVEGALTRAAISALYERARVRQEADELARED